MNKLSTALSGWDHAAHIPPKTPKATKYFVHNLHLLYIWTLRFKASEVN
jgi:hypothetical protein